MDDPVTTGCLTSDGHLYKWSEAPDEFLGEKQIRVVLTVAHYPDSDPMNCDDDNLLCLCQLHHLRLDAKLHAEHAKRTRIEKDHAVREAAGQLNLFDDAIASTGQGELF